MHPSTIQSVCKDGKYATNATVQAVYLVNIAFEDILLFLKIKFTLGGRFFEAISAIKRSMQDESEIHA